MAAGPGQMARGRGGEIPRVCHPADVMLLYKNAQRMRTASNGMWMREASVGAGTTPSWHRAVRASLAARREPRMPLAAMLYGTTRLYPYGCDLRAGFTCRICTHRGCRAAGRSAGSASQTMTRRVMDVPTSDQLGGEISRLGRGRRVRPAKSWRTAWARVLKFEGPLGGLGRALLTPTAGAAPNRGSTRETHTYGDPWRRTQSVWQGSAPRRSTEVVR